MPFPDRPRVSRETRLLLTTLFLSLAALWVLARIRFPEQPRIPNPVAPLLTQLAPGTAFEDLERAVFELEPQVVPALHMLSVRRAGPVGGLDGEGQSISSLRFRNDAVVALIDTPATASITGGTLVAHDPVTGLSVLQTRSSDLPPVRIWTPQWIDYPRYFLVSDVSQGRFSLHPVFVGHLNVSRNSTWLADVWGMPSYATVPNGAFVFTTSGLLAGLVIGQPETPAIVPADTLISFAQRLLEEGQEPPGWLGIDVQPLTPQIRTATGMTSGVVVAWVDPQGPAAGKLVATDIIEVAGEHQLQTIADWEAGPTRLTAGEVITLRIWRNGRKEEVELTALPARAAAASSRLGLTMRVRSGVGAEVLSVEEGSIAMRAGIAVDDVLTRIGDIAAPTPAQVTRAFAAAKGRPLLVAITRGTEHFVVGLVSQ
jgi:hypothetical protein